jgi:hypothetical protein
MEQYYTIHYNQSKKGYTLLIKGDNISQYRDLHKTLRSKRYHKYAIDKLNGKLITIKKDHDITIDRIYFKTKKNAKEAIKWLNSLLLSLKLGGNEN